MACNESSIIAAINGQSKGTVLGDHQTRCWVKPGCLWIPSESVLLGHPEGRHSLGHSALEHSTLGHPTLEHSTLELCDVWHLRGPDTFASQKSPQVNKEPPALTTDEPHPQQGRFSTCLPPIRASWVVLVLKNLPANAGDGFDPWGRKIPWRRAWQPTSVFLPGESQWTEEPGRLQAKGSQKVGHDWVTKAQHMYVYSCEQKLKIKYI